MNIKHKNIFIKEHDIIKLKSIEKHRLWIQFLIIFVNSFFFSGVTCQEEVRALFWYQKQRTNFSLYKAN